jgi:hypothetical protein
MNTEGQNTEHSSLDLKRSLAAFLGAAAGLFIASRLGHTPFAIEVNLLIPIFGILLIALHLSLASVFLNDTFCRIAAIFIVFPGFILAATFAAIMPPTELAPQVLVLYATGIVFSVWLGWISIRHHCRVCDLNHAGETLQKLGFHKA